MLAREAFNSDQLVKDLELFVPILIDGDDPNEKKVMARYGVRGYPTLKFANAKGDVVGEMGQRTAAGLSASAKSAFDSAKVRLTKPFKKIMIARQKLTKAVAKGKHRDALKAIKDIEKVGHKGADLEIAKAEKKKIETLAKKQFDEAKAMVESKPAKAKRELKKIAKDFVGLPLADEAKKLAASIE